MLKFGPGCTPGEYATERDYNMEGSVFVFFLCVFFLCVCLFFCCFFLFVCCCCCCFFLFFFFFFFGGGGGGNWRCDYKLYPKHTFLWINFEKFQTSSYLVYGWQHNVVYRQIVNKNKTDHKQEETTNEPRHEKTNNLVSDLVRHKPGCTTTKDG